MKGIILAAGRGTRLYPMTKPVCKPLLPVYDKPMLYYPLAALMQAGCNDILIIVPPREIEPFYHLFGDGDRLGIRIRYIEQPVARGIADAFILGAEFIDNQPVMLALGDNIFHSASFYDSVAKLVDTQTGAAVFGYWVEDPRPFGVVEFNENGHAVSIEEKPRFPKSNYIIPGLYYYDAQVTEIAANLQPSARGELEITDINLAYLAKGALKVIPLCRETLWMDAGTAEMLLRSGAAIARIQHETGRYVGCIEEIALNKGYITPEKCHRLGRELKNTLYGSYLECL